MVTIGANQNLEKIKEEVLAFAERMKDRELVILGHDNIDVDAVLSGILLSKLFNYLKIKNHFYILESVKEGETYNIVKGLFGIDMKQFEKIGENEKRLLFFWKITSKLYMQVKLLGVLIIIRLVEKLNMTLCIKEILVQQHI